MSARGKVRVQLNTTTHNISATNFCRRQELFYINFSPLNDKLRRNCFGKRNWHKIFKPCRSLYRIDPRTLDVLLGEIVLMNARTELYFRFLKKQVVVSRYHTSLKTPCVLYYLPSRRLNILGWHGSLTRRRESWRYTVAFMIKSHFVWIELVHWSKWTACTV